MIQGIDHAVIISPNLDEAVANAIAAGFTVVPGGTHADGMTHNALIAFADGSYIELIAPTGSTEGVHHRWFPRLHHGGGLVDLCLLSTNLDEDAHAITHAGRGYVGPVENGRARPDGERLQWKGAFPHGAIGDTGWPFLIEDVTPRALRVPDATDQTTHANGAMGVAGVTIHTTTLEHTTSDYEAIAGTRARRMTSPLDDSLLATFINFPQSWIMITRPTAAEAMQRMERVGRGPHALTLRTHPGPISPGRGRRIPAELMSGAVIELD